MSRRRQPHHWQQQQQQQRDGSSNGNAKKTAYVGTLDLHYHTRPQAISALTEFLEKTVRRGKISSSRGLGGGNSFASAPMWVLVVTGTGSHSPMGPVLRDAVSALLNRRQIRHFLNANKGSFTVDANSGITLYKTPSPVSSKIIVAPSSSPHGGSFSPSLIRKAKAIAAAKKQQKQRMTTFSPSYNPLPSQVAKSDSIIMASRSAQQQANRIEKKEKKDLQKAISLSKATDDDDDDSELLLQRAMEQSQREYEEFIAAEQQDHLLESSIRMSQEEYERNQQELQQYADTHEHELEEILRISQEEFEQSHTEEVDDDEDLRQILEMSKLEQNEYEKDLLRVLEASKVETNKDDEELRRVLELSRMTYSTQQNNDWMPAPPPESDDILDVDDDDVDAEMLRALEQSRLEATYEEEQWRRMHEDAEQQYRHSTCFDDDDDDGGDIPMVFDDTIKSYNKGSQEIPLNYPSASKEITFVD